MAEENIPFDDEIPNPHDKDPNGDFDINQSEDAGIPVRHVRTVDGVSSSKTYAVLSSNGADRLCIRWLYFKQVPERNRNGTLTEGGFSTLAACFKVHVEKDHRTRTEISPRSFSKFGLPDVFWYKHDRYTGIVEIPFCYMPSNPIRMKLGFDNANLPGLLWALVCQPSLDLGGEIESDKRSFAKWVYAQIGNTASNFNDLEDKSEIPLRGYPVIRAFWEDLSYIMDDVPNVQFNENDFKNFMGSTDDTSSDAPNPDDEEGESD